MCLPFSCRDLKTVFVLYLHYKINIKIEQLLMVTILNALLSFFQFMKKNSLWLFYIIGTKSLKLVARWFLNTLRQELCTILINLAQNRVKLNSGWICFLWICLFQHYKLIFLQGKTKDNIIIIIITFNVYTRHRLYE